MLIGQPLRGPHHILAPLRLPDVSFFPQGGGGKRNGDDPEFPLSFIPQKCNCQPFHTSLSHHRVSPLPFRVVSFSFFVKAEAGSVAGDGPEYPLSSVLRKNKGTLSVVAEYRKILKSGASKKCCAFSVRRVIKAGRLGIVVLLHIGLLPTYCYCICH